MSRRLRPGRESAPRPFWQPSPCPPWCVTGPHQAATPPEDRLHESTPVQVVLSGLGALEHDVDEWQPQRLTVVVRQEYREAEPSVILATDQRPDTPLTIAEAAELVDALIVALTAVRRPR